MNSLPSSGVAGSCLPAITNVVAKLTPAAWMPQVDRAIVKERARRLRECGAEALRRHLQREVGTTHRILAESTSAGRTEQFTAVRFTTPVEPGSIVERTIAGHDGRQLLAA